MVTTVIWRKKAILKVEEIALYLETEISEKSAENFIKAIYATIEKVKAHPGRGRKVAVQQKIQFINADKYRQLFYRVNGKELIILDVFDVRQHPDKRPYSS